MFSYRIRVLDSSTLTPVILHLREHHAEDASEFLTAIDFLESYLVRRAVCRLTSKAYNRVFPGLLHKLMDEGPTASVVRSYLSELGGDSQVWPSDRSFEDAWLTKPAYETLRAGKARMILEAIEQGMRDPKYHEIENIPTTLQIEHVLPRGWSETDWPLMLKEGFSPEAAKVLRANALHTFGNLTLVTKKLNPSMSNSSFAIKRPEITRSLLALNNHFGRAKYLSPDCHWTEDDIADRARELFALALKIWPGPLEATKPST
jgi:hypothetical protein